MRKLFLNRIFIITIAVITCFSSVAAFSQDFVFANESEKTSSETVSAEIATLSGDISTEGQSETGSESQSGTAGSETNIQTEATGDTEESKTKSETKVTYSDYDLQPTTIEEVQAWINAYVNSGNSMNAKPHWQYEVDSSLMPNEWRCAYVEDANYSEGKYWTVFPKPMFRISAHGVFDVYDTNTDTFITGFDSLPDAVSYVNGGAVADAGGVLETGNSSIPYTIKVTADTQLTEMLSITNSVGVTITTDSGFGILPATIERIQTTTSGNTTRHFKVDSDSRLILENIILKGNWDGSTDVAAAAGGGGVHVAERGALVLETGAEITNCYRADMNIPGLSAGGSGGAVYVDKGTFTMNDGKIYGNFSSENGGGVGIAAGEFKMSGGIISNNRAAGTSSSDPEGYGGGIFVDNGTSFTMSGGSVLCNSTNSRAGGVGVKRSYFEMSGGVISGNYADLSGGGVCVSSSTFYMCGGSIHGANYTDFSAGGVRVGYDNEAYANANDPTSVSQTELTALRASHEDTSYFYMTGGDITGNEAKYCGGGVVVRDGAKFYMGAGSYTPSIGGGSAYIGTGIFTEGNGNGTPAIKGNLAHYAGGGVFMGTFEIRGTAPYPTFYKDSARFYMYEGARIDGNQTQWVAGAHGHWLYGGGVHVNLGCEFEMNGGDIINNTAAYCGGGVSVAGAAFTMNGGHISGNSTDTSDNNPDPSLTLVAYGGGVWIGHAYTRDENGDGDYSSGMSHPAGSTFTMTGGLIGGLDGSFGTGSSGSGTYYGNHAEDDGGGVYVGGSSHFTMRGGAQINYNDTENSGGGVYVGPGDFGKDDNADGVADSSFTMENGYILNNASLYDGGGVAVKGTTFHMSDGYISGNSTTDTTPGSSRAGGVYVGQGTNANADIYHGDFTMTGGVVGGLNGYYSSGTNSVAGGLYYGNHAVSSGGGVYVTDDAAFTMRGTAQVNYNDTDRWGGGVYVCAGENGTGNTSFTMEQGYILNNKSLNDGGGLYLSGVAFTLKDGCYISGNKTTTSPATSGGLFIEDYTNDAGTNTYQGKLTIEGGLIGGTALYTGNASNDGTASEAGGPYYGNYAAYYGGGMCAVKADVTMTGGSIAYNTSSQYGGGLYLFGSTFIMMNAVIEGNKGFSGGGVGMHGQTLPATIGRTPSGTAVGTASMTMGNGASVQNNTVSGVAGGIEVVGTLTMKAGSRVDNNTASTYGGGIRIYASGQLTMEADSVVSNNTSRYYGGGVYVYNISSSAYMDVKAGALITGNTSNTAGGGIAINTSATSQTNINIKGRISGNKASTYGGGIYSMNSAVVNVSGAAITANMASKDGGGIYTQSTGLLTVSDSTDITNNVALGNGGGICTTNLNYSNLSVLDDTTTFSGNRAAYATAIDATTASNYDTYVSDSISPASLSVYSYALNNWDINYAAAPGVYTIIFDPNGGTFTGSVENLEYLYVAAANVAKPLANLGYVMDSYSDEVTYVAANDLSGNAALVNATVTTGVLVQTDMVVAPTKVSSKFTGWQDGSGNPFTSTNMATTAYYDSTGSVSASLATTADFASATAPKVYAQWSTYSITLVLDNGVTWTELANNVAVTFDNATTTKSMTALFTNPDVDPLFGDYYTTYPKPGYLNGITNLGTDTWTVTADLPNQYFITGITIDSGNTDGSSYVQPANATSCEIVITIGKTGIPWGHWIYK